MSATNSFSWAGWRVACVVLLGAVSSAAGADVLFPEPLHLTRRISDPISGKTSVVEEYCSANRVVTVQGRRVAIADYERQQLTEIDHEAATYSIVRFDDLARANAQRPAPRAAASAEAAAKARPGLKVNADSRVALSREALDVLIGAAYPNARTWQHDAIAQAVRQPRQRMQTTSSDASSARDFSLPSEQSMTWEGEGRTLVFKNEIVAVDNKPPPPDLMLIPRGARQVDHSSVTTARLLQELDGGKAKN